jgi:hypothetical protein
LPSSFLICNSKSEKHSIRHIDKRGKEGGGEGGGIYRYNFKKGIKGKNCVIKHVLLERVYQE